MSRSWLALTARAWLLALCCLTVGSLAPLAWGWRPALVVSGSMRPAVGSGDVVLIDPDLAPRPGRIALIRSTGAPSGRLLHRVVQVLPDGALVTKGDANREVDTDRVDAADVLGSARLVLPGAGHLLMVSRRPDGGNLTWALLTGSALAMLAAGGPRPAGRHSRRSSPPNSRSSPRTAATRPGST